ncbi:hypothetical protein [Melittangium boletus]|uniref:Uncharacterized protein n=1 Tax=Melittangium boletus DSM 14713 TaxID=1294270 RepID=A0A250IEH7_9BACT|nr:hypothetical protein [Melittangium boletus]ATB29648.1 hypothetical protein MEBOL_003103 [Melittangium boletus DSM 14713]
MVRAAALSLPMNTARVAEGLRPVATPRTQTAAPATAKARVGQSKDSFGAAATHAGERLGQVLHFPEQGEERVGPGSGSAGKAEWSEEQISEQARGTLAQLLQGEGMSADEVGEFMTNLFNSLDGNASDVLGEELVDLSNDGLESSVF